VGGWAKFDHLKQFKTEGLWKKKEMMKGWGRQRVEVEERRSGGGEGWVRSEPKTNRC